MQERKPMIDNMELLRRTARWSSEAEWTTEELREVLRDGGVEPEGFVGRLMVDVQRLLQPAERQQDGAAQERPAAARPLLMALREETRLPVSAIADAMAVPVTFLATISRHPAAVPGRWRQELARRAARTLQVDQSVVVTALEAAVPYEMAASRDMPYPVDAVRTYADILARAGMTPETRQFWQDLATDATP